MEPRFIADTNVGRLAKWLRILGYDVTFDPHLDDPALVRLALEEGRILLTRDTQLMRRRIVASGRLRAILIGDDHVKAQVRQVVESLDLGPSPAFSRCLECNEPLIPKLKEEVAHLVPPYVYETQSQFMLCPACRRIYWRGTHWQRMSRELEQMRGEG